MTPAELADNLIANQPDLAESLLYFLVWATSSRDDPAHEAQLEDVEERLYSRTEHSRVHREAHRRLILKQMAPPMSATSIVP